MLDFITTDPFLSTVTDAWRLTGFNRANTDAGRLYARLTENAGQTTIELFKSTAREPADLVAQGTAAPGALMLAQANDSGLSGSCLLAANASGVGHFIAFYACDEDLDAYEADLDKLLDNDGAFAGVNGFERFIALAKRTCDGAIIGRLRASNLGREDTGFYLSSLVNLDKLAEPAALLALALIFERLSGAPDERALAHAKDYRLRFLRAWAATRLEFDLHGTGAPTLSLLAGDVPLVRG